MKRQLVTLGILLPFLGFSQIGGNHVYEFLAVPVSTRAAALGGSAIAINDGDISLAIENPSLFTDATSGKLSIQYLNYISDINFGTVTYAHHLKNIGTIGVGLQYMNGGEFTETDQNGYIYGTFGASEMALNLSYAKSFDSIFFMGATLKPVYSQLENYNSYGLVMDVGASYTSRDKLFTAGILLKNMGAQITQYIDETGSVPFDLQAGISTKLAHAPFRFSLVAHHLHQPKLSYNYTNVVEPSNVEQEAEDTEALNFFQETMNHVIIGIEFVPTKSFFLRAGFNGMRFQELKLDDKPAMVGFSWGFGFRVKKLHFSYANARYHLAGISNQFAITTNLNDYFN